MMGGRMLGMAATFGLIDGRKLGWHHPMRGRKQETGRKPVWVVLNKQNSREKSM